MRRWRAFTQQKSEHTSARNHCQQIFYTYTKIHTHNMQYVWVFCSLYTLARTLVHKHISYCKTPWRLIIYQSAMSRERAAVPMNSCPRTACLCACVRTRPVSVIAKPTRTAASPRRPAGGRWVRMRGTGPIATNILPQFRPSWIT